MKNVPAYARLVSKDEIIAEDYNLNIRRYVDNAPPPEPHDVRAHIHGGVPVTEIDALGHYWSNYTGLRIKCFQARANDSKYADFTPELAEKRQIAKIVTHDTGVQKRHAKFLAQVEAWWLENVREVERLAPTNGKHGNVYALRRKLLASVEEALKNQSLLNTHQVRGAFANYVDDLKADLKSIAASGWGPELIPDDEIVQSQFPEVLEQLEKDRTRLAELLSQFAAAKEEDYEDSEETGILQEEQAAKLREEKKKLDDDWKQCIKELKGRIEDLFVELKPTNVLPAGAKKGDYTEGLSPRTPEFGHAGRICEAASSTRGFKTQIHQIEELARSGEEALARAKEIEARLATHKLVEQEAKDVKARIKATENRKQELVEAARAAISNKTAKAEIIARLHRLLIEAYRQYLRADQRACVLDKGCQVTDMRCSRKQSKLRASAG
jgi:type I restriction enzyme M protein